MWSLQRPEEIQFQGIFGCNRTTYRCYASKKSCDRTSDTGRPVLIDPGLEDPLDFMMLDLSGTFYFVERGPKRSMQHKRAKYTLELLRLNTRDYLVSAQRAPLIGIRLA